TRASTYSRVANKAGWGADLHILHYFAVLPPPGLAGGWESDTVRFDPLTAGREPAQDGGYAARPRRPGVSRPAAGGRTPRRRLAARPRGRIDRQSVATGDDARSVSGLVSVDLRARRGKETRAMATATERPCANPACFCQTPDVTCSLWCGTLDRPAGV